MAKLITSTEKMLKDICSKKGYINGENCDIKYVRSKVKSKDVCHIYIYPYDEIGAIALFVDVK